MGTVVPTGGSSMRTLILTVLITSLALVGCKEKTPPRPAVSTKAPPVQGRGPVAVLERGAFVPADAVAYGSFDSQRLLAAAKPVMVFLFGLRAHSSRSAPMVKTSSKVQVKTVYRRPKLTYTMLAAMAKRKYGIDVGKLGRLTVIGVVPPPRPGHKLAFFAEPVFLASAAAFTPPPNTKPVETVGGARLYAVTGRPTRSRIVVVGDTVVFGETTTVRQVLAVRLGKAPRIDEKAPLVRSIRSLRAVQPKAFSFMVMDFGALRKRRAGKSGLWEKELESGGLFLSDKRLVVLVNGLPKRIALASGLISGFFVQAQKALPMVRKKLVKAAGAAADAFVDEVKFALKNVVVKAQGDTLRIRLQASPVKVMTVLGMLGYFMLVRQPPR